MVILLRSTMPKSATPISTLTQIINYVSFLPVACIFADISTNLHQTLAFSLEHLWR